VVAHLDGKPTGPHEKKCKLAERPSPLLHSRYWRTAASRRARLPIVDSLIEGTVRWLVTIDRSVRLPDTSARKTEWPDAGWEK